MDGLELTREDFDELREQHEVLLPFRLLALELQSRAIEASNGSVWETLPCMDSLLSATEHRKATVNSLLAQADEIATANIGRPLHEQVESWRPVAQAASVNNLWVVLNKYYSLTDQCPLIYFMAVLLNPQRGLKYFENHWDKPNLKKMIKPHLKACQDHWRREYLPLCQDNPSTNQTIPHKRTFLEEFLDEDDTQPLDEFSAYLKEVPIRVPKGTKLNLFRWWDGKRDTYPTLSQLALDTLSTPAMAAECERVFSGAKLMISDRRRRLGPDIIQAVQCLRYWWRSGIISDKRSGYTFDDDNDEEKEVDDEMRKAIEASLLN